MIINFDFELHTDPSRLAGTHYFEFVPGPYRGAHWVPGARFIHEYTFCLFEGIFEKHFANFDHFGCQDVNWFEWAPILADMTQLQQRLCSGDEELIAPPFSSTIYVKDLFDSDAHDNQQRLGRLLSELTSWVLETLTAHDCVSVLGL